MLRNLTNAKRGRTQELIDVPSERQKEITGLKPSVLKPFGSSQRVRVSSAFDSLDDVSGVLNCKVPRAKIIGLSDS